MESCRQRLGPLHHCPRTYIISFCPHLSLHGRRDANGRYQAQRLRLKGAGTCPQSEHRGGRTLCMAPTPASSQGQTLHGSMCVHPARNMAQLFFAHMLWTELCPPESICRSLNPTCDCLQRRVFRRLLGSHEDIQVGPQTRGIGGLIGRGRTTRSLSHSVGTEEQPRGDRGCRQARRGALTRNQACC